MKVFGANSKWLLIAVFYALINDSFNCTFRTVTDNFSASLKGIYNVTTEQECLSKCSADPECTFLTYYEVFLTTNEGRCEIFEDGDDVQDFATLGKAFSYSFEEQETSCPTTTVSKPQNSTKPSTAIDTLKYPCTDYPRILTKKALYENPTNVNCSFGLGARSCDCCTLKTLNDTAGFPYSISDYDPNSRVTVCSEYNVKAPNAVAQYICEGNGRYILVMDTESGSNPEFPDLFGGLKRVDSSPIFYVPNAKCRPLQAGQP